MKLVKLNFYLEYPISQEQENIEINNFYIHSQQAESSDLFFPEKGYHYDSHQDILPLVKKGVYILYYLNDNILSQIPEQYHHQIIFINKNFDGCVQKLLARISKAFFNSPDNDMSIIGVTGTNGKTSTTYIIKSILEQDPSYKVGLIGTIVNIIGSKKMSTKNTTPNAYEIYKILAEMKRENCNTVVMEISSHALVLNRCFLLQLNIAIFTNISQEHLDFHKTQREYFLSKMQIFLLLKESQKTNKLAIFNQRIEESYDVTSTLKELNLKYTTIDCQEPNKSYPCFIQANVKKMTIQGTSLDIMINKNLFCSLKTNLIGSFNVSNILSAMAMAYHLNFPSEYVIEGTQNIRVEARFENITPHCDFSVMIDFGHTPDALEKILQSARMLKPSKLIIVFGCGGDRDNTKRSVMGNVATQHADITIITSDNPRSEDPSLIIKEIASGVDPQYQLNKDYFLEIDRKKAIELGLSLAEKNSLILIAGKGHEQYQIIEEKKIPFNDKDIVLNYMEKL